MLRTEGTLDRVQGNARLAEAPLAEEVAAALDATDKDVEIGGAGLAAGAIELGLVDELHIFRNPVLVGGGTPLLPPVKRYRHPVVGEMTIHFEAMRLADEDHHFCVNVADVDATLAELRARDVEVLGDAIDLEAIGRRLGFLKDINGNIIELAAPLRYERAPADVERRPQILNEGAKNDR